jgi:hypothetical protein
MHRSRDSAATVYGLEGRGIGVRVAVKARFFPSTSSRPVLRPILPPVQLVSGALSPGVKQLESEADHSLPFCAEAKTTLIDTSTRHKPSLRSRLLNYLSPGTTLSFLKKFMIWMGKCCVCAPLLLGNYGPVLAFGTLG